MPNKPQPKPASAPRGPKGVTYRLMDPWAPENRRSNQQRANFPYEHACAFCGSLNYRHRATHQRAKLFCSPDCMRLYKGYRQRPRHSSRAFVAASLPPDRTKHAVSPIIRDLLRFNTSFIAKPWKSA